MAEDVQIGGSDSDRIFLDTDFTRTFEVLDKDADPDGNTAKNVSGFALTLDIRKEDKSSASKKAWSLGSGLSIVGIFNASRTLNTQRVKWTCADTDLTIAIFGAAGGTFRYSLKRTDGSVETILLWGDIVIDRATQAA